MQKSIVWEGLADDTEEHCAVNFLDTGIMVRSEIEGWAEGKPVYAEYAIHLDKDWNVLEFDIDFHVSDYRHTYQFRSNEAGQWSDSSGKSYPEFDGCHFIDITLTPFTNSLPINSLHLAEGASAEFDLLYVDVLNNDIRKDRQKYTRMPGKVFRFENDEGRFSADIEVDEDGFVTHYPQLFEMYKPH